MSYPLVRLGDILTESKVESEAPDNERRIRVRLNCKGVEQRPVKSDSGTTKYYKRSVGQFIYGKQNLHKGAFGVVPPELDGFESSSDIPTFDVAKNCMVDWIIYFLRQGDFYLSLESIAKGTGSRRIQPKVLYEVKIPLPSIEEQEVLLERLQSFEFEYDEIKSEEKRQKSLIDKLRQSILQDAIQGTLVPQDPNDEPASELLKRIKAEKDQLIAEKKIKKTKPLPPLTDEEKPFDLPQGWEWSRLGKLIRELRYGTSKKCNYESDGKAAVLRIPNVSSGILELEDLKYAEFSEKEIEDLTLVNGDLIIIRSNGSPQLVGKSLVVSELEQEITFAGYLVRVRLFERAVLPAYCKLMLSSPFVRNRIEKNLRTTTGVKNINSTEISSIPFALPPLSIQKKIISKHKDLLQFCDELEQQMQQSAQAGGKLSQSVLQQAFVAS